MLGEAYVIVHGSSVLSILIYILAVLLFSYKKKRKGTAFVFYCIKLSFLWLLIAAAGYTNVQISAANEKKVMEVLLSGQEALTGMVYGELSDIRQTSSGYKVYMNCTRIVKNGIAEETVYKGRTKTCIYIQDITDLKIGQRVTIRGSLKCPDAPTNPGEFDAVKYYKNRGIYFLVYDGELIGTEAGYSNIKQALYMLRNKTSSIIDRIFAPSDGAIIKAMLLGDKGDIDADTKRLYQRNGIAHILAISGLHIALLGMSLFRKLRKWTGSYVVSGLISIIIIILYGLLTGLAVSTIRAILMMTVDIVGRIIGRSADMLTSLGLSGIVLCMINPYVIGDAGFLLSFGAVFAIGAVFPCIKEFLGNAAAHKIISAVLISLSINIVTMPVIIYFYYEFPLYGVLLNLIVVPCVGFVFAAGILSVIAGALFPPIAGFIAAPAKGILAFYDMLCRLFEKLPYSSINTGHIRTTVLAAYYLWLGLTLYVLYKLNGDCRRSRKKAIFFELIVTLTVIVISVLGFRARFRIVFLDVGQGDGILITTKQGTNILIDGGSVTNKKLGETVMLPAIKYYGMSSIDYVFITHGDEDHLSGVKYLLGEDHIGIKIKNLIVAVYADREALNSLIAAAEKRGINVMYMKAGDMFWEEGRSNHQLAIQCLSPSAALSACDTNSLSLVLKLTTAEVSALFTGDIGADAEKEILAGGYDINADILKVAHHGSRYSSSMEFLMAVNPDYSVISCGTDNSYGHPHPETLERFRQITTTVLRTDRMGAVIFELTQ